MVNNTSPQPAHVDTPPSTPTPPPQPPTSQQVNFEDFTPATYSVLKDFLNHLCRDGGCPTDPTSGYYPWKNRLWCDLWTLRSLHGASRHVIDMIIQMLRGWIDDELLDCNAADLPKNEQALATVHEKHFPNLSALIRVFVLSCHCLCFVLFCLALVRTT